MRRTMIQFLVFASSALIPWFTHREVPYRTHYSKREKP